MTREEKFRESCDAVAGHSASCGPINAIASVRSNLIAGRDIRLGILAAKGLRGEKREVDRPQFMGKNESDAAVVLVSTASR